MSTPESFCSGKYTEIGITLALTDVPRNSFGWSGACTGILPTYLSGRMSCIDSDLYLLSKSQNILYIKMCYSLITYY